MSFINWLKRLVEPGDAQSSLPAGVDVQHDSDGDVLVRPEPRIKLSEVAASPVTPFLSTGHGRQRIFQAFDAGMPVDDRTGLSGRQVELSQLRDGVIDQSKHGIVFGPRGSGKTSLARVFGDLADEAHHVVLYQSASGDMSFPELLRPFIEELGSSFYSVLRDNRTQKFLSEPFAARDVAALFAEDITANVILVFDEFDRISSQPAKHEVAALMKLLSDMRASVRLLIVGIATNLEDLLEGHPSLRRHLVSIPIGSIASEELHKLLLSCAARSGMTFEDDAAQLVVKCATGSPYHLRFFGMHAALAAHSSGPAKVSVAAVREGLTNALSEWSRLNTPASKVFDRAIKQAGSHADALLTICVLGALNVRFSEADVATTLQHACGGDAQDTKVRAAAALEELRPLLLESAHDQQLMFHDSLLPQFFLLKLNQLTNEPESGGPSSSKAVLEESLRSSLSQQG